MNKEWSIIEIQDIIVEREEWDKKNLYATDSEKCARGLYFSLKGEKATTPMDPQALRRMEVGTMIEKNQVEKLKSLGILIEAQRRIFDEEHNVSGRHDGIVISPVHCSPEAKEMIERKKEIHKAITSFTNMYYRYIEDYQKGELNRERLMTLLTENMVIRQDLYDEDAVINKALLVPNPLNELIVMEIKSIVEKGFEWRCKDGVPMDSHRKQAMFYLWKLRETYPNIKARVVYVDTSYQRLVEFDVPLDEDLLSDMKRFWKSVNESIDLNEPLPAAPSIVLNPKTHRYQVNFMAEWCRYHDKCTGQPNWLELAKEEVKKLNSK